MTRARDVRCGVDDDGDDVHTRNCSDDDVARVPAWQICAQLRALAERSRASAPPLSPGKDDSNNKRRRLLECAGVWRCDRVRLATRWLRDVMTYNTAMSLSALLLLLLSLSPLLSSSSAALVEASATTAASPSRFAASMLLLVYVLYASVCVRVLQRRRCESRVRTLRVMDAVAQRWPARVTTEHAAATSTTTTTSQRQQQQQREERWRRHLATFAYTPASVYRLLLAANTRALDNAARARLSSTHDLARTSLTWWLQRGLALSWTHKSLLRRGACRADVRAWRLRRCRPPHALCKLLDAVRLVLDGDAIVLRPLTRQQSQRPPLRRGVAGSSNNGNNNGNANVCMTTTTTAAAVAATVTTTWSSSSPCGVDDVSSSDESDGECESRTTLGGGNSISVAQHLEYYTRRVLLLVWAAACVVVFVLLMLLLPPPPRSHDDYGGGHGVSWRASLHVLCQVLVALLGLLPMNAIALSRVLTLYANVYLDKLFHVLVAKRAHGCGDRLPRFARLSTLRTVVDVLCGRGDSGAQRAASRRVPIVCAASLVEAFGTASVIAMLDHDGIVNDTVTLPARLLLFLPRRGSSRSSNSRHNKDIATVTNSSDAYNNNNDAGKASATTQQQQPPSSSSSPPRRSAQDCCVELPLAPPSSQRESAVAIGFVDAHDASRYAAHIHPLCLCALVHAVTPPLPPAPTTTSSCASNDDTTRNDAGGATPCAAAVAEHVMEQVRLCDCSYAWARALHWLPRLCGFADKHARRFVLRARILHVRRVTTPHETAATTTATMTAATQDDKDAAEVALQQACTLLLEAEDGVLHAFTLGTPALVSRMCSAHWCGTHAEVHDAEMQQAVRTAAQVRWQSVMDLPNVALAHRLLPARHRRDVLYCGNKDDDHHDNNNDNNNNNGDGAVVRDAPSRVCVVEHVLVDGVHVRRCPCTRAHIVVDVGKRNGRCDTQQQQQRKAHGDGEAMRRRAHSHSRGAATCASAAVTTTCATQRTRARSAECTRHAHTRWRSDSADDAARHVVDVVRDVLCHGHVLLGLVGLRDTVRPDVQPAMAALDAAGVRCMYFHRGDERQAKSFGARVGLQTDWNCCIPLRSDAVTRDPYSIRAQLPLGITAIRRHLQHVDAVPLQVNLFSDARSVATRAMLSVLQDNHEVVIAVGSVLQHGNTRSFLQADVAVGVLPTRRGLAAERELQQLLLPQQQQSSSSTLVARSRRSHHHHHRHNELRSSSDSGSHRGDATAAYMPCPVIELSDFAAAAAAASTAAATSASHDDDDDVSGRNDDADDVTCFRSIAELVGCSCALRAPPTPSVLPVVVTMVQQARLRLSGMGNCVEFVLHANAVVATVSALALVLLRGQALLGLATMLYELNVFVPLLALSCTYSSSSSSSAAQSNDNSSNSGGNTSASSSSFASNASGGGGGAHTIGSSGSSNSNYGNNNSSSNGGSVSQSTSTVYAMPDVMRLLRRRHNYYVRSAIVRHSTLVWALRYAPSMLALLACAMTASSTLTSYRHAHDSAVATTMTTTTTAAAATSALVLTPDVCAAAWRAYVLLTLNVWLVVHCATHVSRHRRYAWRLRRPRRGGNSDSDDAAGSYNSNSNKPSSSAHASSSSSSLLSPSLSSHYNMAAPPPLTLYLLHTPSPYARRWLALNALALAMTLCVVAASSPVAVWRRVCSPSSSPSPSVCVPLLLVSPRHAVALVCMPVLLLLLDAPLKRWRARRFAHMQRFRQLSYGTRLGMHSPRGDYEPESYDTANAAAHGGVSDANTTTTSQQHNDVDDVLHVRPPLTTRLRELFFRYVTRQRGRLELNCVCCDHMGSNSYASYNVATCTM